MFNHENLKGRVAVITGGAGVLCSNFAELLATQGCKIAILDLNENEGKKLEKSINASGGQAKFIKCNVLEKVSVINARNIVYETFGECDILINGAGGNNIKGTTDCEKLTLDDIKNSNNSKTFFDLDSNDVSFVFNLNYLGTLIPTQVFSRDMVGRDNCTIVNITSMNAFRPLTKIPAYSSAKAAVKNLTEWLCVHFSQVGIRVNAIAPGFFSTNQNKSLLFDEYGLPTKRTQRILNATPMNRFGKSEELNGALLFLLDEKYSSFITGTTLIVDGGFNVYSGV